MQVLRALCATLPGVSMSALFVSGAGKRDRAVILIELATGRMWRAAEPGERWIKLVSWDIEPEVAAALVAVGVRELVR